MTTRHWTLAGLSLVLVVSALAAEFNPVRRAPVSGGPAPDASGTQRVIVRLRTVASSVAGLSMTTKPTLQAPGTAAQLVVAIAAAAKLAPIAQRAQLTLKASRELQPGLLVMEFSPATSDEPLAVSLTRLRADPQVQYAEEDARRYPLAVPADPLFPGQWYLQNPANAPSAVNAQAAWDLTTGGAGIVIADLDTGVSYDHPDLQRSVRGGKVLPGYDFVSDVIIANDGDGRDSDPADPGDWVTSADVATSKFTKCTVEGSSWHGTRTAGIIAAQANNGTGISGLLWRGFILPVRVLGKCGGFDSDILAAMLWAAGIPVTGVPDNPFPARVENLSLGSTGASCPASYADVVNQLAARGVLVVASAGNEGGLVDIPANCAGVAAIAGLRQVGTKVGYSNLGPQVAVGAPAGNCVNVGAGQPCLFSIDTTSNNGATVPTTDTYTDQLNYNVGTSFSSPIVAGIAGLMLSANGNLGPAQLLARIREGAVSPFPVAADPAIPQCHVPLSDTDLQGSECSCTSATCGAGMANALGALSAALRPIAAVRLPASVSAGQNVVLRGAGSAAACGHSISAYAWSVLPGTVNPPAIMNAQTATATVVAPSSDAFTLRMTVTDDAGRQDFADVTVGPLSAISTAPASAAVFAGAAPCLAAISASIPVVVISPGSANVTVGSGTQSFLADVANTTNTDVSWQVNGVVGGNAAFGTISAVGLYRAPVSVPTPASVTVTAVSAADPARSASAAVVITTPAVPPAPVSSGSGGGGGAIDSPLLLMLSLAWLSARLRRRPQ